MSDLDEAPEGWAEGQVTIQLIDGERRAIDAFIRGNFSIHERWDESWRVSHVPTGLRIEDFATLDQARKAVARIEELADWGKVTGRIMNSDSAHKALCPKVRSIIEDIMRNAEGCG